MEMMQFQQTMNRGQNIPQERRCYTVDELMEILGVGRKAVYSLIHQKVFPTNKDQQRGLSDSQGELPCLAVSAAVIFFQLTQADDRLKLWRKTCYHLCYLNGRRKLRWQVVKQQP